MLGDGSSTFTLNTKVYGLGSALPVTQPWPQPAGACWRVLRPAFLLQGRRRRHRPPLEQINVLVDEHDYHTFQPLLYQVATGLLERPPSATRSATSSTGREPPSTRTR